jgi:hypothetical protein
MIDTATLEQLRNLPVPSIIVFGVLLVCALGGIAILLYVAIRAALDAWRARREQRAAAEAWFADQERIHRESK